MFVPAPTAEAAPPLATFVTTNVPPLITTGPVKSLPFTMFVKKPVPPLVRPVAPVILPLPEKL